LRNRSSIANGASSLLFAPVSSSSFSHYNRLYTRDGKNTKKGHRAKL
jgi:hypothetical protein